MTLDVRGSLKNTKVSKNIYVFIDELLANAIDAYLIRKDQETYLTGFKADFSIEFTDRDLMGDTHDLNITCNDNGSGLGDDQTKAFVTKDTSYKDDLSIEGIGKCKGSGRIQYLHHFSSLKIESVFKRDQILFERQLSFDDSMKEIDEDSFVTQEIPNGTIGTSVTLSIIKPDIYDKAYEGRNLQDIFSAEALQNYVIVNFLQRLVSLKNKLGEFSINFDTRYCLSSDKLEQLSL